MKYSQEFFKTPINRKIHLAIPDSHFTTVYTTKDWVDLATVALLTYCHLVIIPNTLFRDIPLQADCLVMWFIIIMVIIHVSSWLSGDVVYHHYGYHTCIKLVIMLQKLLPAFLTSLAPRNVGPLIEKHRRIFSVLGWKKSSKTKTSLLIISACVKSV